MLRVAARAQKNQAEQGASLELLRADLELARADLGRAHEAGKQEVTATRDAAEKALAAAQAQVAAARWRSLPPFRLRQSSTVLRCRPVYSWHDGGLLRIRVVRSAGPTDNLMLTQCNPLWVMRIRPGLRLW